MKVKTHNDKYISIMGTCLQGYISVRYDTLVKIFGEPCESDGYKVDAEWILEFENGDIATIYNYKTGKNYLGSDGQDVEDITHWHIGGSNQRAKLLVNDYIKEFIND